MKTDLQLQQDVIAELKWEPAVHAAQIGVEVKDGVVTLAGEVSSFVEKWQAERAAQRVHGVKALAIDMKVKLSALGQRTDTDIAQSAKNILSWTTLPAEDAVQVMVEGGWLTLTGEVEWQYQRQAAVDCVRHLVGVTGVSNQITLKPVPTSKGVRSDIQAALQRAATADGQAIGVDVKGGNVTLTGTVHSWTERELATRAAWSTAGVNNVVDQLDLVY